MSKNKSHRKAPCKQKGFVRPTPPKVDKPDAPKYVKQLQEYQTLFVK